MLQPAALYRHRAGLPMKCSVAALIVMVFMLSGCGNKAVTTQPSSTPTTANTGPMWSLPGVQAAVNMPSKAIQGYFEQPEFAELEQAGQLIRSSTPTRPGQLSSALMLSVDAMSSSAKVRFSTNVFLGPLQYEQYAASGLPAISSRARSKARLNTHFVKNYCLPSSGSGACARVGRATGIIALLSPLSIRSERRGFTRATDRDFNGAYGGAVELRPPGYLTGMKVTQAGHLLAYVLGGPVRDPRNFVTQWNFANAPAQSAIENEVKDALTATESGSAALSQVLVRVTPVYQGSCVVPYEVRYEAYGSNGWQLASVSNNPIARTWTTFERGSDGLTVAVIRNAEQKGQQWVVPGQDPQAQCVPPGYSGS